jgi:site-specific DNA recombinase
MAKAEAEEVLRYQTIQLANPEIVRGYVKDLKHLLEGSGLVEKKAFLRSFIERIEVGKFEAKVTYTIPMPPGNQDTETVGVLPFMQFGRPCRTRTCDQWIKSPLLYQLS